MGHSCILGGRFSNNLIERNSRRAGPIFGLHEDFPYNTFKEAKLDPYQKILRKIRKI